MMPVIANREAAHILSACLKSLRSRLGGAGGVTAWGRMQIGEGSSSYQTAETEQISTLDLV
jgi:hypothetical protein